MTPEQYITDRLEDQIKWYDTKSLHNQKRFKQLRMAEIIAASFIPFLTALSVNFSNSGLTVNSYNLGIIGTVIVGILGIAITIIASILNLGQHQKNWIEYRTTCENLKKEKYLFITNSEPYDNDDAFTILVQRVEALVSKENTNWAQFMMKPQQEKKDGKN